MHLRKFPELFLPSLYFTFGSASYGVGPLINRSFCDGLLATPVRLYLLLLETTAYFLKGLNSTMKNNFRDLRKGTCDLESSRREQELRQAAAACEL